MEPEAGCLVGLSSFNLISFWLKVQFSSTQQSSHLTLCLYENRFAQRDVIIGTHETPIPVESQSGSSFIEFPFILLNILLVDVPFILSNDNGEAGPSIQPVTLYLTITVSANMAFPISPNNPPKIPTEGNDSPAEEATEPSIAPGTEAPVQSTIPESILPLPDHLAVETDAFMPRVQAETSPIENAQIDLRRADEAMKSINRLNIKERVLGNVKGVMDTLGPITEVRVVSFYLSFTEPTCTLSEQRWQSGYFQRFPRLMTMS